MTSYPRTGFLIVMFLTAALAIAGQDARPSPTPDDTVRISTSLIQLDVVVTDKDGKQITDLKPEDFTVLQDGKEQKITALSFVTRANGQTVKQVQQKAVKGEVPPPQVTSKGGRIITFILDDGNCMATVGGLAMMRDSIRDFIEKRMLPDDRVAIYRTRGGSSLMQLYTSNKEVLRKAANKITLLREGGCGSTFDALRDDSTIKVTGQGARGFENEQSKEGRKAIEEYTMRNQVRGTIGVLRFVVDRLKSSPQRKVLFLLSEGIMSSKDSQVFDDLRDLADRASRASVVINTMSAKGLTVPGMLNAEDEVLPGISGGADNTFAATDARITEEQEMNAGIAYLAYATGGRFVNNRNYLDGDIRKILDTETGYYLIGYEPTEETFKGKDFHKIDVRVSRPGVRVSSRKGFFSRTDKDSQPVYKSADSALFQAAASPFDDNGMNITLTTLVGSSAAEGSYLRALVHIPGSDITLGPEENGERKAAMDVVAVALDEKGKIVEEFNRSYPIKIPARGVEVVQKNGLDFSADIPFAKPGVYSFRLVVRDANSKRIGSAGEVFDIPNLKKGDLWVSGLAVGEMSSGGSYTLPAKRPVGSAFSLVTTLAAPSVRKFTTGTVLPYVFEIHNAKIDKATSRPSLTREIKIYKNGELVSSLGAAAIEPPSGGDASRIVSSGTIRLTEGVAPGQYVLQIIVRDALANRVGQQSLDFEVLP